MRWENDNKRMGKKWRPGSRAYDCICSAGQDETISIMRVERNTMIDWKYYFDRKGQKM